MSSRFGKKITTGRFDTLIEPQASAAPAEPAPAADAAHDEDEGSETRVVLRPNQSVVKILPGKFVLKEAEQMENSPFINSPKFNELKVNRSEPALIVFPDRSKFPEMEGSPAIGYSHLHMSNASSDEKKKVIVRVSYLSSTQFTGLRIHINNAGKLKNVQRFHLGGVGWTQDPDCFCTGTRPHGYAPPAWDPKDATSKRPSWHGVSPKQIKALSDRFDDPEHSQTMSDGERLIVHLHRSEIISPRKDTRKPS
ncbi:hypothetical protein E8E11_010185 [Didymella keratinophila]|nr:hypothetical protein E8E11_010185 [Didymella keratinophila]